jgi:hypothetical protein
MSLIKYWHTAMALRALRCLVLIDVAKVFRLAARKRWRIFQETEIAEIYETLRDLPHVHVARRQNHRPPLGQAAGLQTRK